MKKGFLFLLRNQTAQLHADWLTKFSCPQHHDDSYPIHIHSSIHLPPFSCRVAAFILQFFLAAFLLLSTTFSCRVATFIYSFGLSWHPPTIALLLSILYIFVTFIDNFVLEIYLLGDVENVCEIEKPCQAVNCLLCRDVGMSAFYPKINIYIYI